VKAGRIFCGRPQKTGLSGVPLRSILRGRRASPGERSGPSGLSRPSYPLRGPNRIAIWSSQKWPQPLRGCVVKKLVVRRRFAACTSVPFLSCILTNAASRWRRKCPQIEQTRPGFSRASARRGRRFHGRLRPIIRKKVGLGADR
jgi:hypothetical protein